MSWLKRVQKFNLVLLFGLTTVLVGCGVKGDPLPPEKPTPLGRGRPTYKRATEEIKLQKHSNQTELDQESVDEEHE